jgi:hypothetical protein
MAGGSTAGTYAASLGMTSTAEFRSLFTAGSAEGLEDDGSPVVTVYLVQPCGGAPCIDPGSR